MNKKPSNPLAFPVHTEYQYPHSEGMTLRDYFAAKAMDIECGTSNADRMAKDAYIFADAMLKEREKEASNDN